jgi:hypothetical protein
VSRRIEYNDAVSLMLGRFMDDPVGLAEAMEAVDALADDPYPEASVSYGKAGHRRLRAGVYRVLYEITDDAVIVLNVGRSL